MANLEALPAAVRHALLDKPELTVKLAKVWATPPKDPREPEYEVGHSSRLSLKCWRNPKALSSVGKAPAIPREQPLDRKLIDALTSGEFQEAERLLHDGASAGRALYWAIPCYHGLAATKLLLEHIGDPNSWDPEPVVVSWALAAGHEYRGPGVPKNHNLCDRLDLLLAARADVNATGRGGESPLHKLARLYSAASSKDGKDHGLTLDVAHAAWHNLVARGADSGQPDEEGLFPIDFIDPEQRAVLFTRLRASYGAGPYILEMMSGTGALNNVRKTLQNAEQVGWESTNELAKLSMESPWPSFRSSSVSGVSSRGYMTLRRSKQRTRSYSGDEKSPTSGRGSPKTGDTGIVEREDLYKKALEEYEDRLNSRRQSKTIYGPREDKERPPVRRTSQVD